MKNHTIDPSIAFCTKSATSNFNGIFENENVIYRKLINPFSDILQKNCYVAIDNSQAPELGELTLIDYGTDAERIGEYKHGLVAQGKVIAYSQPSKGSYFHLLDEQADTHAHFNANNPNVTKKVSEAIAIVLESGLLDYPTYKDLYQLQSSIYTVNHGFNKGAM